MGKIAESIRNFFTDTNNGQCENKDCKNCPFPACEKETGERGQKITDDKNIKQSIRHSF